MWAMRRSAFDEESEEIDRGGARKSHHQARAERTETRAPLALDCERVSMAVWSSRMFPSDEDKMCKILSSISFRVRLFSAPARISLFFCSSRSGRSFSTTMPSSWSRRTAKQRKRCCRSSKPFFACTCRLCFLALLRCFIVAMLIYPLRILSIPGLLISTKQLSSDVRVFSSGLSSSEKPKERRRKF